MKASTRWTIVIVVLVLIAFLLWLWLRREEPKPPVAAPVVTQPGPKPEPAPEPKPEPKPEPVVLEPLAATVLFDFNRAEIRPSEVTALDDLAAKLKARPGEGVEIAGYADRIGSAKYNVALSKRRAAAVRDYLVGKGVQAGAYGLSAMGEADPATGDQCKGLGAEKHTNRKLIACLQPDRRVELKTAPRP